MPIFKLEKNAFTIIKKNEKNIKVVKKEEFEKFNPSVLGLAGR